MWFPPDIQLHHKHENRMTGLEVNNSQTHQSSTEQSDNNSIYMTRLLNPLWLQVRRHQVKSSVWIWVFFYNKGLMQQQLINRDALRITCWKKWWEASRGVREDKYLVTVLLTSPPNIWTQISELSPPHIFKTGSLLSHITLSRRSETRQRRKSRKKP